MRPGPDAPLPVVGELFAGRYRVEALLGRGGMGSVYRVHDRELDELIALKLLDAASTSGSSVERFRREVRLARRVTHHNVARTYDLGEHGGLHFLTMELVEGSNLRDWLRKFRPNPARVVELAGQIAAGLGSAHAAGIIHRDLKPSNVLLDLSGGPQTRGASAMRVALTDFGVARMSAEQTVGGGGRGMLGTPAYMAPEQVAGEETTPATDLYALGLMIFEMLAGRLPFSGDNAVALALARLREEPVALDVEAIPAAMRPLLARTLAREPGQRHVDALAFLAELDGLRGELGAPGARTLTEAERRVDIEADTGLATEMATGAPVGTVGPGELPRSGPETRTGLGTDSGTGSETGSGTGSGTGSVALRSRAGAPTTTSRRMFGTSSSLGLGRRGKPLAVLPFRYRGPADSAYLVDAMLEELTDLLSQTRGLEVSSAGATRRFGELDDRDPRTLGRELGVALIVDGTVQLVGSLDAQRSQGPGGRGPRLRVSARVLDVEGGFQLWSDRFDGEFADVFEIQDKLCKRIAEALRVELEIIGDDVPDDLEAIESYMRARSAKLLWRLRGPDGAIALYKQTLARAPRFKAALAGLAFASMRGWFLPEGDIDADYDWPRECAEAVAMAMEWAPDHAETRVAAAALAIQNADLRGGALHLREALRIAPTCALAHEYLGRLLIEGPKPARGVAHLEQALQLDPELEWCKGDLARYKALRGDLDGYQRLVDELSASSERYRMPTALMQLRVGAWTGDRSRIEWARDQSDPTSWDNAERVAHTLAQTLLADYDIAAIEGFYRGAMGQSSNTRAQTYFTQIIAEQCAYHGDLERALHYLEVAAELLLTDALWLDNCPLFEALRAGQLGDEAAQRFATLRQKTRRRADAVLTP